MLFERRLFERRQSFMLIELGLCRPGRGVVGVVWRGLDGGPVPGEPGLGLREERVGLLGSESSGSSSGPSDWSSVVSVWSGMVSAAGRCQPSQEGSGSESGASAGSGSV